MLFHSLALYGVAAALLPFGTCKVAPPDAPIPGQWRDALPQAWDNSMIRWARESPTYNMTGYKNFGLDQVMDGNGTIRVCMRWGSNQTVTEAMRQQILAEYTQIYRRWWEWLPGYDNFPYSQINFRVVGWAVRDRSLLQGSTDGFDIYTNTTDMNGFPDCDHRCYRHEHQDGDYSGCPGGPDHRYHQYFFLDPAWGDFDMGAAAGQGIDVSLWGWEHVGSKMGDWPILLHEMGHTLGFLDYLDNGTRNHTICDNLWIPPNAPAEFVMKPGDEGAHVPNVTEIEGWLFRYWWTRFSQMRGWQNDNTAYPPLLNCPATPSKS